MTLAWGNPTKSSTHLSPFSSTVAVPNGSVSSGTTFFNAVPAFNSVGDLYITDAYNSQVLLVGKLGASVPD